MSKGKQILVDLTPLLDVILIILFMFVARSQATSAVNNAEQNNKDNETKKEYDTVQRENNSLKALDKACKTITVSIKSEKDSWSCPSPSTCVPLPPQKEIVNCKIVK